MRSLTVMQQNRKENFNVKSARLTANVYRR